MNDRLPAFFLPEVPGSESVLGGVLEDVSGIGEVGGGAFVGEKLKNHICRYLTYSKSYIYDFYITML